MKPPGLAPTTSTVPRVEQISAEGVDLSTRTKQMRFLVAELGVTRRQAHSLIVAYERDQNAPLPKSAQKTYRLSFLAWLMEQRPLDERRARPVARQGRDYRPRDNDGRLIA